MKKRVANIICAFVWNKNKRDKLRYRLTHLDLNKIDFNQIAKRYQAHIQKLKRANRKIRICFYVTENQKWKAQALFDELKKNDRFDVFAVFAPRTRQRSLSKEAIETDFEFFRKKLDPLYMGYDIKRGKYKNLRKFKPDVVFYSQPWDIHEINQIKNVSKYALTCYIPYAIAEAITPMLENVESFHYLLWRHYTAHQLIKDQYNKTIPYLADNLKVVGYPVLDDIIFGSVSDETSNYDDCVIYAPHHSLQDSWLKYGTFDWNGKYILEYAKQHPEFNWVFRPHPDFRTAVINNKIMTPDEIDKYFDEWCKVGVISKTGSYVDLFKRSKCMITDCGSFITEYFVTKKPLIHLRSQYGKDYNGLNDVIKENLYKIHNLKELQSALQDILEKNQDPMAQTRMDLFKELGFDKNHSVKNIINDLQTELCDEKHN